MFRKLVSDRVVRQLMIVVLVSVEKAPKCILQRALSWVRFIQSKKYLEVCFVECLQ